MLVYSGALYNDSQEDGHPGQEKIVNSGQPTDIVIKPPPGARVF
jgi:hypothetical protein